MSERKVSIELSEAEALVLFEFLSRVNSTDGFTSLTQHGAEQKVMWLLENWLESILVEPFQDNYLELLAAARDKIGGELIE